MSRKLKTTVLEDRDDEDKGLGVNECLTLRHFCIQR